MYALFAGGIVVAYFFGSVPFGLLLARARGKDLRAIGSGNIGATNVARALGRKWGYVCFLLDVLKGLLPVVGVRALAATLPGETTSIAGPAFLALWLAVGIAAIVGHIFPIYLRFKGGKGVSTSFGVALGIWPYFTLSAAVALVVWVAVVLVWRYISLASICASAAFAAALVVAIAVNSSWRASALWPLLLAATAIPVLVIVRHRENIKRLASGTEGKIRSKKK